METISSSDGQREDDFGYSVALGDDYAVIGARRANDSSVPNSRGVNSGAVYVYTLENGQEDPEKIPEPSAVAGLILMGGLATLKRFSKER